jgi:exopolysaccharide biosynthesis polyprenyl glycosylphosphotransferase
MTLTSIAWVILFHFQNAYSYQRFTSFSSEVRIVAKVTVIGSLVLMGMVFLLRPGYIPRSLVILFVIVSLVILLCEKLLLFHVAGAVRKRGHNRKSVLIVGTDKEALKFVEVIKRQFSWGLDIVGFLSHLPEQVGKTLLERQVLGVFSDIHQVLHTHPIEEVIVAVSGNEFNAAREVLDACMIEGVQVRIASDFLAGLTRIRADVVFGVPIISIGFVPEQELKLAVKRLTDICFAFFGLLLMAPLFGIVALIIKASSRGPVFYRLTWFGKGGKTFVGYKFRTMIVDADNLKQSLSQKNEMRGPVFKIRNDPRVTAVGRILRKYSIDELPQLWSVLKGDMSLVGPRPPLLSEVERYDAWHRRRFSIKPGLTCLWQASGRNRIQDFNEWCMLDLQYIDNWSLQLDFKILFQTVRAVLRGTGC